MYVVVLMRTGLSLLCMFEVCVCLVRFNSRVERGWRWPVLSERLTRDIFRAEGLRDGLKYAQLGNSSLVVSEICLGSMTWGEQNSHEEAKQQMDLAFDQYGVNFIDTAEMYPVPASENKQGQTERTIGKWLRSRCRDQVQNTNYFHVVWLIFIQIQQSLLLSLSLPGTIIS